MKSASAGTVSGCLVWVILFVVSVPCLVPLMLFFGNFALYTDFSNRAVQPILCPANTTLQVRTYDTTTTDSRHHNVAAVPPDAQLVPSGRPNVVKVLYPYIIPLSAGVHVRLMDLEVLHALPPAQAY